MNNDINNIRPLRNTKTSSEKKTKQARLAEDRQAKLRRAEERKIRLQGGRSDLPQPDDFLFFTPNPSIPTPPPLPNLLGTKTKLIPKRLTEQRFFDNDDDNHERSILDICLISSEDSNDNNDNDNSSDSNDSCNDSEENSDSDSIKSNHTTESNGERSQISEYDDTLDTEMVFSPKEAREEIPVENGSQECNVRRFVNIVDNIYKTIPATAADVAEQKAQLVRIVKSKLEGKAYEIADFATQTWSHIKTALLNNLTCPTDLQTLLTKVSTCQQRQDETVGDFAHRIQILGRELEAAERAIMTNNQTGLLSSPKAKYSCFINGLLNKDIRTICRSRTEVFEDAVDYARQEEARMNNTIQQAMQTPDTSRLISALANERHNSRREVFFKSPEREERQRTPERSYDRGRPQERNYREQRYHNSPYRQNYRTTSRSPYRQPYDRQPYENHRNSSYRGNNTRNNGYNNGYRRPWENSNYNSRQIEGRSRNQSFFRGNGYNSQRREPFQNSNYRNNYRTPNQNFRNQQGRHTINKLSEQSPEEVNRMEKMLADLSIVVENARKN
jgi:hypothetical protein